jgi:uncharacterized protein (TIGR02001 family)
VAFGAELSLEGRFATELVEQGVSLTHGEPGMWLGAEFGGDTGGFAGLHAHNIDVVPNGALDRNLFVRISPYVGWRMRLTDHLRVETMLRYVLLPDAIPDSDYMVVEAAVDWREAVRLSVNHSADRFNRGETTTAYELAGTWPFHRGFALRGLAGWHDYATLGGNDYAYAGVGLVAGTPRFDIELAYHVLDDAGERLFHPIGGSPGLALSVSGRLGREPSWAANQPAWLERVSLYGELRSKYMSSGITQTYDSPAVQLGIEYATPGGTYVEIWGTNVDYVPDGDPTVGADSEIDYTLGHRFALSKDWKLTARVSMYAYPGADERSDEWDETEYVVETTWRDRLRLKYGFTPDAASVHQPKSGYAVRWRQPVGKDWRATLEIGHKDKRDWGPSYDWGMVEVAHTLGPVNAMLRYWYTSHEGRRADGTADPTWELAWGWGM